MKPKITVFMAAYNAARYIEESIKSVLDQTFGDFELLIVNDGSTDQTVDVVNGFRDSRIRLLHNDKNSGLTYTRNVALTEAKGDYIAILDSDDVAVNNRLELQYAFFREHPDFALCGGHGVVIDAASNPVADNRFRMPLGPDNVKMTLLFRNPFINSTVMYKTTVLRELNGYRHYAPAEDYELFTRISDRHPVSNLDAVLVKYRIHNTNTSSLQSDLGRRNVQAIKRDQLRALGVASDNKRTDIMLSILEREYHAFYFADYLSTLTELKTANRILNKYPETAFEEFLFTNWFEIIYSKKAGMNALNLLFQSNLFQWKHLKSRHFRKALKLSIKGFGRITK
jgi:glycosyltransferase involved in cell wall biosynthesis